jgi:RNA polymerase sigma-70 factor (ECF subfamily)
LAGAGPVPPEPGTVDEPTSEEVELAARARAGDRTAYSQLVATHQQIAFRVAYLVTGSAPEAEDAAQEGFVKAYRSLHRFDPERPFRPWLLTIVANEARNRRRSAGRRLAYEARAVRLAPSAPDRTPEQEAEAAETRRALLDAVNRLPEPERLVVGLRYFLELSEAETAAAAGVPPGTVKSRLWRAMERLRSDLEEARP